VPENTVCNTLCDNPWAAPNEICQEVQLYEHCTV
jgi:hypothetical protein